MMHSVDLMVGNGDASRPSLRVMIAEQHANQSERLPWPIDWFDAPVDAKQVEAMQMLFATVLAETIVDVCRDALREFERKAVQAANKNLSKCSANQHIKPKVSTIQRVTQQYSAPASYIGSKGFCEVCSLAGFDSDAVEERVRCALCSYEGTKQLLQSLKGERRRVMSVSDTEVPV